MRLRFNPIKTCLFTPVFRSISSHQCTIGNKPHSLTVMNMHARLLIFRGTGLNTTQVNFTFVIVAVKSLESMQSLPQCPDEKGKDRAGPWT